MMICEADFNELFPRGGSRERTGAHETPDNTCLARWEDDGGQVPAPRDRHYDPAAAGMVLAMLPAAMFMGAALSVAAAFGRAASA